MRPAMVLRRHWCLTGIGNPEPRYRGTRHNIGLYVLDRLKDTLAPGGQYTRQGCVHVYTSGQFTFIRSDIDYINLSGPSIRPSWQKLLQNEHDTEFIVVHDELSLPLGKVQLRDHKTSHRGHNGLKSILHHVHIPFKKLSIGIGRPQTTDPQQVADYVLSKTTDQELRSIDNSIAKALQLININ
uniref:Peptidyl-tRNA hydrolase n=1 Tax=Nakaseomyces delphensis TaxID=51657 RepID=A7WPG3_NAKDE|nr:mitochondrial peptidyl-tRNA hydrolase [Nakaseomyces delphensis]